MRLLRSWPAVVPTGRAHVQDGIERLVIDNYDYGPLADVDDDVLLIEWDIAVDGADLDLFAEHARRQPDRVIVAPYRLHVTTVHNQPLRQPVWCHRRPDGSHVDTGDPTCAYFGFGLVYLPRALIRAFRAEWDGHFSDGSFGGWHRRHVTEQVPIVWDVRPAHLHYNLGALSTPDRTRRPLPQRVRVMPEPMDDAARQAWLRDPARKAEIAALLREREGLLRMGKTDRVPAVDEQLAIRGYRAESEQQEPGEPDRSETEDRVRATPPKGRSRRPRQATED